MRSIAMRTSVNDARRSGLNVEKGLIVEILLVHQNDVSKLITNFYTKSLVIMVQKKSYDKWTYVICHKFLFVIIKIRSLI